VHGQESVPQEPVRVREPAVVAPAALELERQNMYGNGGRSLREFTGRGPPECSRCGWVTWREDASCGAGVV